MQQLFAGLLHLPLHPHLFLLLLLLFRSDSELYQWFRAAPTLPGTPSAGFVLPSASTSGPSSHMTAPVLKALAGEMCMKGFENRTERWCLGEEGGALLGGEGPEGR